MTLKRTFKIKERLDGGMIAVQCPIRDCKGVFHVHAKKWADSWEGTGRSCPYCFKPSSLPPRKS